VTPDASRSTMLSVNLFSVRCHPSLGFTVSPLPVFATPFFSPNFHNDDSCLFPLKRDGPIRGFPPPSPAGFNRLFFSQVTGLDLPPLFPNSEVFCFLPFLVFSSSPVHWNEPGMTNPPSPREKGTRLLYIPSILF